MSLSALTFTSSLVFLAGILLLLAGSVPRVQKHFPKLFLNGFMIALLGIVSMVVLAFVLT